MRKKTTHMLKWLLTGMKNSVRQKSGASEQKLLFYTFSVLFAYVDFFFLSFSFFTFFFLFLFLFYTERYC